MDRDWNATAEAVGDGEVPGGAGAVPDQVKEGANGRTRKREVESTLRAQSDEEYERSIQVSIPNYDLLPWMISDVFF
jgi:hypothetical protein